MFLVQNMQPLVNGLISGTVIAVLATAFQVVFLPTRILFLGLAGVYAIAPYIVMEITRSGWGLQYAVAGAVASCVFLSLLFDTLNHAPLVRRGASEGAHMISSLGLYIVTVQCISIVWGQETRALRSGLDRIFGNGSLTISEAQIVDAVISSLLLGIFCLYLLRSDVGLKLRGLADNPVQFALLGHNVDHHRATCFGLAGGLAALASLLTAYDVGFDPNVGLQALLLAIVATMLGGRGSFLGPIIGSLLIGVLRAEVVWLGSARWQEAATFGLLAFVLVFRPDGLLSQPSRLEASYS